MLLCQLESLILYGFAKRQPPKNFLTRPEICEELRSVGKRVFKEMAIFFLDYTPPTTQAQKRSNYNSKLAHAWCALFNSLREHHQIPQGSTAEFETLEEWVMWAQRLKII